mmetsp:Transcript_102166/g.167914  ORF Transcript_102166/g.167914 Transcript_102166/m.167914 type:complete len:80 (+) Transcript_102166:461-700(+)
MSHSILPDGYHCRFSHAAYAGHTVSAGDRWTWPELPMSRPAQWLLLSPGQTAFPEVGLAWTSAATVSCCGRLDSATRKW